MFTHISSIDKQSIIQEYQSGITIKDIAIKYNRTSPAVSYLLKVNGVIKRKRGLRKITKDTISLMRTLYLQGLNGKEISNIVNISDCVVYKHIKDLVRPKDKGLTPLYLKIRNSDRYIEWRTKIQKRDNYTCVVCGKNKTKIHVDHKIQFAILIKDNSIKTIEDALKCSHLWDETNGRVLCIPCHKSTDTFGNHIN